MILSEKNWDQIGDQYWNSSPIRYVIVDDFMDNDAITDIHNELLNHWAWRHKNWSSKHLHNRQPKIDQILRLRNEILDKYKPIIKNLECSDYWSLMYPENTPGNVHADYGKISLTIWLTDEKYNRNPNTGGLIIFDVQKPIEVPVHDDYTPRHAQSYVERNTKGKTAKIKYKRNRAVFFSANNFHTTDAPDFRIEGMDSIRLNLSFAFN